MDREVKYGLRSDKIGYEDILAKEAEEAAQKGAQGTLYVITRQITNSRFKRNACEIEGRCEKV